MKAFVAVFAALLVGVAPAWAVLGQKLESVRSDQQHMEGALRSVALQGYSVHEISRSDGMTVREFVSPSGMVFGVAWEGPTLPNLSQLLGSYFSKFQQATNTPMRHRGPVVVKAGDVVIESGGHPRSFHGRAYVTSLMPSNVTEAVVK